VDSQAASDFLNYSASHRGAILRRRPCRVCPSALSYRSLLVQLLDVILYASHMPSPGRADCDGRH